MCKKITKYVLQEHSRMWKEGSWRNHCLEVTCWPREGSLGPGKPAGLAAGVVGPCFEKSSHPGKTGWQDQNSPKLVGAKIPRSLGCRKSRSYVAQNKKRDLG